MIPLLLIQIGNGAGTVVVADGLEYGITPSRMHYEAGERMHYTDGERWHYSV